MNQSGDNRFSADAELEVELSAFDLLGLTPASPAESAAVDAPRIATVTVNPAANAAQVAAHRSMRLKSPRTMGIAAMALVSLIAIVSVAELAPPQRAIERPVSNWSPVPDPVVTEVEEPPPPTLFANPFDASEVFELPPGLSRDEARAMVADLLLKRASERQVLSHHRG